MKLSCPPGISFIKTFTYKQMPEPGFCYQTLIQMFLYSELRLQYLWLQSVFVFKDVSISQFCWSPLTHGRMKWITSEYLCHASCSVAEHSGLKQSTCRTLIQTVSLPICKSWNVILFTMDAWKQHVMYECGATAVLSLHFQNMWVGFKNMLFN